MPKEWNTEGAAAVEAEPTKIKMNKGDAEKCEGKPLTPLRKKVARKPLGVYLSVKEREKLAGWASEAGVTESEWVRNTIRKLAKLN